MKPLRATTRSGFALTGAAAFAVLLMSNTVFAASADVVNKTTTADHSKFDVLQGPFASGPEVTKACLSCHTEAAKQLHKTTHWTWEAVPEATGQTLGKKNVINNFCVSLSSNEPRCTSCHIGYGWTDSSFDFTSETAVDCLVCHDQTGAYKKFPTGAGHPLYADTPFGGTLWKAPDLAKVAQSVGEPGRENCGACHFSGGGGDGVKHGDIDGTLAMPDKALDVHMDKDGLNFACQDCHTTGGHEVTGSRYQMNAKDKIGIDVPGHTDQTRATCESCHGYDPHGDAKLNDHTDRVACPTCHVPEFARGGQKTKLWWDWSTAGKKGEDGKPLVIQDADGYDTYNGMKGDFVWEANVAPSYYWFNGRIDYTLITDKIDPSADIVEINRLSGVADDPDSRIWPFKVMDGKQPYDTVNLVLAAPHVFGKDDAAYWKTYDWDKALAAGMTARDQPYSGHHDFVKTRMYWPITHMVAPSDQALACEACHAPNGRMAELSGFYMPGRGDLGWLMTLGWIAAGVTLVASVVHGLIRLIASGRKG
jgi:octaheme c-type cytochrome (tetrathionate reductase family)